MKQSFNAPDRSTFDLSHMHRTSFDMGQLIPISCIPTIPGDYITADVDAFVRGMPTIAPIVDKVDIKINHFYVPYRVLWNRFEEFITHDDTYSTIGKAKPTMPQLSLENIREAGATKYKFGRLANYLGISDYSNTTAIPSVNAMPFLAYHRIILDYYSPQRWVEYLQANGSPHPLAQMKSIINEVRVGDGGVLHSSIATRLKALKNVGWNHDYFTNALPTPNLYNEVKLPIVSGEVDYPTGDNYGLPAFEVDGAELPFSGSIMGDANYQKLGTIRNLREAVTMQQYLEKLQMGGGRYMETMKVFWNQDLRNQQLQRPEYIGGDVIPLFVNEVESTAATDKAALGDVGGKPVGAGKFGKIDFQADEFGIYMVIAHVAPKRSYVTITDKMWLTKDALDLPNPQFEGLGDQEVRMYELNAGDTNPNGIFGYVPRYSEYKGKIDRFSGEMENTLKHWHFGSTLAEVGGYGQISPEFIECNPRNDIFIVRNEPDKLLGSFQMNIKAKRKLSINPVQGVSRI